MTHDDIKKLITLAREMGCRSLKVEGVEVTLWPPEPEVKPLDPKAFQDPFSGMSEEQVRLWHVGGPEEMDTKGNEVVPPLVGEEVQ